LPKVITSSEQFEQLRSKASEIRIVRSDKGVKIKLRTPGVLYTYTTNADEADGLIKNLKDVEVIEFGTAAEKEGKNPEDKKGKKEKKKDDEEEE
jgi:type II secretory ATPase GspE/PulE/Tfp pilus assembly ATPase PilB-like protein